jgi:hypothetical protein
VKLLNESGKFLIVGVDHRFGKNNTTDHLYTVENDEGVFKVPEWAIDESSLGTLDELGCPRKKFNPDIRILDATIPEESESHNDNDDAVVAALNRTNELLEKILEHVSSQSKTTTKQG